MPKTKVNKATGEKIPYGFKKSENLMSRAVKRKLMSWTIDHNH